MKPRRHLIFWVFAVFLIAGPLGAIRGTQAGTFTVTNTHNSALGSLRQAIIDANASPGPHSIVFDIHPSDAGYNPVTGVWTIQPLTPLPGLSGGSITLDGGTQTTNHGDTNLVGPEIEINGKNISSTGVLIYIDSDNNQIKGMALNGELVSGQAQPGSCIKIVGASGNQILFNNIGTDPKGLFSKPCQVGIELLNGANHTTIGLNSIAGNASHGIQMAGTGTDSNMIGENYVGLGRPTTSGIIVIPNGGHGVFVLQNVSLPNGPFANTISNNVISGNAWNGVYISNGEFNTVSKNYIGFGSGPSGIIAAGNGYDGIRVDGGAKNNYLYNNYIAGNDRFGIRLSDAGTTDNAVQYNFIGKIPQLNITNGQHGIGVYSGASGNTIGHINDPDRGNTILGNGWSGIAVVSNSNNNKIGNNFIGTDQYGSVTNSGNNYYGVHVANSSGNTIGPSNIIAHNGSDGVRIEGASALNNQITRNSIYGNSGVGIENINGGNSNRYFPGFYSADCHSISGQAPAGSTVEIFSDSEDEGRLYEGSAIATGTNEFTWTGLIHGPNAAATYTTPAGETSEFGTWLGTCFINYLPLIQY